MGVTATCPKTRYSRLRRIRTTYNPRCDHCHFLAPWRYGHVVRDAWRCSPSLTHQPNGTVAAGCQSMVRDRRAGMRSDTRQIQWVVCRETACSRMTPAARDSLAKSGPRNPGVIAISIHVSCRRVASSNPVRQPRSPLTSQFAPRCMQRQYRTCRPRRPGGPPRRRRPPWIGFRFGIRIGWCGHRHGYCHRRYHQ